MQLYQRGSDVSRVLCIAHGKDKLIHAVKVFGSSNVREWVPPALGNMKAEPTVPFGLSIAICVIHPGLPPRLCSISRAACTHTHTGSMDKISSEVRRMDWLTLCTLQYLNTIFMSCCSLLCFQITKLKIDSNPFAKGFRDSSRLTDIER